jgi:hypothetical protein
VGPGRVVENSPGQSSMSGNLFGMFFRQNSHKAVILVSLDQRQFR